MINEIIEEEDEEKHNINKGNDIKKENIEKNNNEKGRKIIDNNSSPIKNIKKFSEYNLTSANKKNSKNQSNLIWNNSPFNKKINTYENIFYKKTFDKYIPLRDKLITQKKNSNGGIILPDLKNTNNSNNVSNNYNNVNLKKSFNLQKMNVRSLSTDKTKIQQKTNINSTDETSAFTHSSKKNFTPAVIANQNYTEDISNIRMGLLSAGSSSNNNIIIPMIPIRRPASNFNFGAGQLWNNFENNKNNTNNNNNIENKNTKDEDKINNNKKENENHNKMEYNNININNAYSRNKSQDMKKPIEMFPNNIYLGMDKIITKLHKIKIEKGMMNSGIMNSLNKKISNDYQTQIEQFKKNHLPRMFNNQNNNNKNIKTINFKNNNTKDNNK